MIFSLSLSAPLSAPASWGLGGAVFCHLWVRAVRPPAQSRADPRPQRPERSQRRCGVLGAPRARVGRRTPSAGELVSAPLPSHTHTHIELASQ